MSEQEIPPPPSRKAPTDKKTMESRKHHAISLVNAGWSWREACKQTGIGSATLSRALKESSATPAEIESGTALVRERATRVQQMALHAITPEKLADTNARDCAQVFNLVAKGVRDEQESNQINILVQGLTGNQGQTSAQTDEPPTIEVDTEV